MIPEQQRDVCVLKSVFKRKFEQEILSCRKHFIFLFVPDKVVVDVSAVGDTGRHPGNLQTVCPNLAKGQISGGRYSCWEREMLVFNNKEIYEDTLPSLKREESVVNVCVWSMSEVLRHLKSERTSSVCIGGQNAPQYDKNPSTETRWSTCTRTYRGLLNWQHSMHRNYISNLKVYFEEPWLRVNRNLVTLCNMWCLSPSRSTELLLLSTRGMVVTVWLSYTYSKWTVLQIRTLRT